MKIRDVVEKLRENGFQPERTKGSHQTWKKGELALTVVCNHPNDDATRLLEKNLKLVLRGERPR
jgi:predicted RNA binding protein YcfA (HicA-like mRNA interferase family)